MSERGTPPGSLRYFAVLFAPARLRPQLDALYDFEAEIRATAEATHEVAHARLGWWRTEVDRLAAGRPGHPVTTALLPLRGLPGFDVRLLHEVLVGADLDLARFTYASWQELEAYCFRAAGALQVLIAAALAGGRSLSSGEQEFARRLGSALRQTEMLRDFRRDLATGHLRIPMDALAAAGLDPTDLQSAPESLELRPVLEQWRSRVRDAIEALPVLLTDARERTAQRHGLVLAALHGRLAERIAWQPSTARADVPPFTRLWTAWRTALRHG